MRRICTCGGSGTYTVMDGIACTEFKEHETPALNGLNAVENTYIYDGGTLFTLYDLGAAGEMSKGTINGTTYKGLTSISQVIESGARFSYIVPWGAGFRGFVTRDFDIYLIESDDLVTWTSGSSILARSASTSNHRYYQWNAAVAYDTDGVGHMMVEASPTTTNQEDVRLVYLQSPNGSTTFSEVSGVDDVIGGGNAWLTFIPGKGLLCIHGSVWGDNGAFWRIRASTLPIGATQWRQAPLTVFDIAKTNIHVADPHLIETADGRILMSVSYNQNSTISYISRDKLTLSGLFDRINGAF